MKASVLVIGAGGAGLTAAVSAAKTGAHVRLAAKTRAGWNTATAFSGGIFTLASGGISPAEHFAKTLEIGCHVNDPFLVKTLTEGAEKALLEVRSWGVDIRFPRAGKASVRSSSQHKLMGGEGFTAQLRRIAQAEKVEMMESVVATELLFDDKGVCGAKFVDWQTGKARCVYADAVILATGGAGQIFSRTDNPARLTGDGYALAHRAGLKLRDMEFIQFYPLGWSDRELPVWMADLELIDFVRLTDTSDSEFMLEKLRELGINDGATGNLYARDQAAVAMAKADRNGGAFLHLEEASAELWKDKRFRRALIIDPDRLRHLHRPVRVAPLEHYFCGGMVIDPECHTDAVGLYACGEVVGGVDGANRIGGNALANIVTFGLRAGANAALECAKTGSFVERDTRSPVFPAAEASPYALRRELQIEMWECLGPVRNAQGLRRALNFLDELEQKAFSVSTPRELLTALEMPGLICSARASAKAALARSKSLGVHFREDSPS